MVRPLVKLGPKYILSLKLVDVETGTTEFSTEDKCTCSEDQLDQLVAVAAAKLRNYFQDAVPIPPLPANAMPQGSLPSPSPPQSAPPQEDPRVNKNQFTGKVKKPASGKSLIYIFSPHTYEQSLPVSLDGERLGSACLQAEVDPGEHRILVLDLGGMGAKGTSGELLLNAEPDQVYFIKIAKGVWRFSPLTVLPVEAAEGETALLQCSATTE